MSDVEIELGYVVGWKQTILLARYKQTDCPICLNGGYTVVTPEDSGYLYAKRPTMLQHPYTSLEEDVLVLGLLQSTTSKPI